MDFSEEIPDGLSKAGKEIPFKVPGNYFDNFPARMKSLIDQDSQPPVSKRLTLIDYFKPALGLAAAIAAVFVLVYWPARLVTHTDAVAGNKVINNDDKIINLVEPIDDQTFYSLLENSSTDEKMDNTELESYIADNYSDFDIYLETQK